MQFFVYFGGRLPFLERLSFLQRFESCFGLPGSAGWGAYLDTGLGAGQMGIYKLSCHPGTLSIEFPLFLCHFSTLKYI